jgi:hypothetical protein
VYAGLMTAVLDVTSVDLLNEEAGRIAAANPPSRVLATVVLGLFFAVGWVLGRTWFFGAKAAVFGALAVRMGYRKGAKVPVEVKPAQPSYPG